MKREVKVDAWEWEHRGFIICATIKCRHLVMTPLGRLNDCYQSGGMHLYCASEDKLACGCCGNIRDFKGKSPSRKEGDNV